MKQSYEQVLQWFLEKQSGSLSTAEQAELDRMLAEDPSFRGLWDSIQSEATGLDLQGFASSLDAGEGLRDLRSRMQLRPAARKNKSNLFIRRAGIAAASLTLVTAGAWFLFFRNTSVSKEQAASLIAKNQQTVQLALANGKSIDLGAAGNKQTIRLDHATIDASAETLQYQSEDTSQNTLKVPAGKTYRLVLSDGTEVWLNAATSIRFPFHFKPASREVFVEGEAFFKVAKKSKQPFIVHTPLTTVQVLGTSFNVNTYQSNTVRTALVEGSVITASADGQQKALQPGQEAAFSQGSKFEVAPFDADEVTGWIGGLYYFYNMPVSEVAQIASRIYGVNFILDKQKFAGKSITGVMDRNKLTEFLSDLETIAQSTYHFSGKDLILK